MRVIRIPILSILSAILLIQCTLDDIEPNVTGDLIKESHYHSSDLTDPLFTLTHDYNNKGQKIKTLKYGASSELIYEFYYNYDDNGNLIRTVRFEESEDGQEMVYERLFSFNEQNQNIKSEYYINGDLMFLQTSAFTKFGKMDILKEVFYDRQYSTETKYTYDDLHRVLAEVKRLGGAHSNSVKYEYIDEGQDRRYWHFLGQDSVLWSNGKEQYANSRIWSREVVNHLDGNKFLNQYFYNEFDELVRETYTKNGDERVRIKNNFVGPVLLEQRRYNVDFDRSNDDFDLIVYEYRR